MPPFLCQFLYQTMVTPLVESEVRRKDHPMTFQRAVKTIPRIVNPVVLSKDNWTLQKRIAQCQCGEEIIVLLENRRLRSSQMAFQLRVAQRRHGEALSTFRAENLGLRHFTTSQIFVQSIQEFKASTTNPHIQLQHGFSDTIAWPNGGQ